MMPGRVCQTIEPKGIIDKSTVEDVVQAPDIVNIPWNPRGARLANITVVPASEVLQSSYNFKPTETKSKYPVSTDPITDSLRWPITSFFSYLTSTQTYKSIKQFAEMAYAAFDSSKPGPK